MHHSLTDLFASPNSGFFALLLQILCARASKPDTSELGSKRLSIAQVKLGNHLKLEDKRRRVERHQL